jgi:hypothetical protein
MADYPRSAVASDCRWDGRVDIDSSNASHHRHLDREVVTDPNRAAERIRPVEYVRAGMTTHCYMCFPPHPATWVSRITGALAVCDKVLDRLVREGKALKP